MNRKLTVYMDGKPVSTFAITEYPNERLNNVFNIGRSGFWGVVSGVKVANTAFSTAQIKGFLTSTEKTTKQCNEMCTGCKGKCLFGTCVCPAGKGGAKCDKKMVLATFHSEVVDPYHAIMVQSHKWGGRSALPLKIPLVAVAACTARTADIQAIRMIVSKSPAWVEKKKCYSSVEMKGGKFQKVKRCYGDGINMQLADGMLELGIPGKDHLVYNHKSVKEWGNYITKPSTLTIKPGWRTPLVGEVPLSGEWTVAWAQQSPLSTGKIALSNRGQWQIQAAIDIVIAEECTSNAAAKSDKYVARVPPSEPKNVCYPDPCGGKGGKCEAYTFSGHKHKCTCKPGWDQSGRTLEGYRTNADSILPCDTNGAALKKCPAFHHFKAKICDGMAMHRMEVTNPGQGCGHCIPDDSCVKCITIRGESYHLINDEFLTGVPTQQCRFVDLRGHKGLEKGKTITKTQAEGMVREDAAKEGKDLNDISPSAMIGAQMCQKAGKAASASSTSPSASASSTSPSGK